MTARRHCQPFGAPPEQIRDGEVHWFEPLDIALGDGTGVLCADWNGWTVVNWYTPRRPAAPNERAPD